MNNVNKQKKILLLGGLRYLLPVIKAAHDLGYYVITCDYLPDNIDTMKGQEILMDDFGKGAFAMEVVEGMTTKEVTDVKKTIEAVDGVADVIWYDSISDLSVPIDSLPQNQRHFSKRLFHTDGYLLRRHNFC